MSGCWDIFASGKSQKLKNMWDIIMLCEMIAHFWRFEECEFCSSCTKPFKAFLVLLHFDSYVYYVVRWTMNKVYCQRYKKTTIIHYVPFKNGKEFCYECKLRESPWNFVSKVRTRNVMKSAKKNWVSRLKFCRVFNLTSNFE